MHVHETLIRTFYEAFAQADAKRMIDCYHDDILFEDPVFGVLRGHDAKQMWQMLVRPGIRISCTNIAADEISGNATWTAVYTFGKTQRPVNNRIEAQFAFKDGKISHHIDRFDVWKWSRQALGITGILFGWTPWMQQRIQSRVLRRLHAFQKSQGAK